MFDKILKPEIFQGKLNLKNYFEGWYYKYLSEDTKTSLVFIPGISTNLSDPHAFIQVYITSCLLYTSPSPRDLSTSRMPSSA